MPSLIAGQRITPSWMPFGLLHSVLPMLFLPTIWLQRWRTLAWESLRPVTRETMLLRLGGAVAIDLLQIWLAAMVVIGIVLFLTHPESLDPSVVLPHIVGSACTQVLNLGVVVWVLMSRSQLRAVLIGWLATMGIGFAMSIGYIRFRDKPELFTVALIGGALAVVLGLALMKTGYRRWCRMELDVGGRVWKPGR